MEQSLLCMRLWLATTSLTGKADCKARCKPLPHGCSASPLHITDGVQEGSPYEGGVFVVDIQLPPDYPFAPPKVRTSTQTGSC